MRDQFVVILEDNAKVAETKRALEKVDGVVEVYADLELANAAASV